MNNYNDRMKLYAFGGPLQWQPTEAHQNALIAEAYEGSYLIIPFSNGFALHRGQYNHFDRLAYGQSLDEVKMIADILASRSNADRKRSHPEAWEQARRLLDLPPKLRRGRPRMRPP